MIFSGFVSDCWTHGRKTTPIGLQYAPIGHPKDRVHRRTAPGPATPRPKYCIASRRTPPAMPRLFSCLGKSRPANGYGRRRALTTFHSPSDAAQRRFHVLTRFFGLQCAVNHLPVVAGSSRVPFGCGHAPGCGRDKRFYNKYPLAGSRLKSASSARG
jgi:hypothetical protein